MPQYRLLLPIFALLHLVVSISLLGSSFDQQPISAEEKINQLFFKGERLIGRNEIDSTLFTIDSIRLISDRENIMWGYVQASLLDGFVQYKKNNLDSASIALIETISQAKKIKKSSYEEGRANLHLGLLYRRLNNLDKSKKYTETALEIFQKLQDSLWISNALNNLAIISASKGDYPKALEEFKESAQLLLPYLESDQNAFQSYSSTLGNLSVLHELMGNIDLAMKVAREALALKKSLNNSVSSILSSYLNIAEIHFGANNYDSANYYYEIVINWPTENDEGIRSLQARALQKKATVLMEEGKSKEAITTLRESIQLRQDNYLIGLDDTYKLLARYYLEEQKNDSAMYMLKAAFDIAIKNNNKRAVRGVSNMLVEAFKKKDQFDSALYYKELSHLYSDSIFNESNDRKYNNLRVEMETAEKGLQIELLQKENEIISQQNIIQLLTTSIIIIILLGIIIFIIYQLQKKKKALLVKQNEHKAITDKQQMELQHLTLQMINKNKSFQELVEKLHILNRKEEVKHNDIRKLINSIEITSTMEEEWSEFQNYFKSIHPSFYNKVQSRHTDLTQYERRLLALIKVNLSNREIASLLNVEQSSVRQNKYRLKKKLNIDSDQSLETYVTSIL